MRNSGKPSKEGLKRVQKLPSGEGEQPAKNDGLLTQCTSYLIKEQVKSKRNQGKNIVQMIRSTGDWIKP